MKCLSGFLVLCILAPVFSWIHGCPPAEDLGPLCTCEKTNFNNVNIFCKHIGHAHALSEQLSALKNYKVDLLKIQNCGPLDMVDDLFRNLSIHRLIFLNCNFGIFSLFSLNGMQHTFNILSFYDCNVTRWVRSNRFQLSSLLSITLQKVNLNPILISEDFANYPSKLQRLHIIDCKITRLEKSALKKFSYLKYLHFSDNLLNSISRNSLPPKLLRLISLGFSGNPLETLPNDIFKQMPRLKRLYLGYTRLKTLHQEIFLPVWNELDIMDFNNVWLNCDCNSTWLLSVSWKKKGNKSPSCLGFKKSIQEITYREICPE